MPIKRKNPHTLSSQADITKTRTRQKRLNFRVLNKEDEDEDGEDLYSADDDNGRLFIDIEEEEEEEEQYTSPNKPPSQPVSQQSSLPSVNIQPQLDFSDTSSRIVFKAPPRRKESHEPRSYVWQYFKTTTLLDTYEMPRSGKIVQNKRHWCQWTGCTEFLDAKTLKTATTGLSNHLRKHKIFPPKQEEELSESIASGGLSHWRLTKPKDEVPTLEQAIKDWVINTLQPFTVVENYYFQRIFKAAGITLPIRTQEALKEKIMLDLALQQEGIKSELLRSCTSLSLSLDMWTSKNKLSMLGVIGHWITPNFQLESAVLAFEEVDGTHSGENQAEVIFRMLERLRCLDKLLAITGDNAENNDTLVEHLYEKLLTLYSDPSTLCDLDNVDFDSFFEEAKPPMQFQGEKSRIRCFAHVLNLICKDILSGLKSSNCKEAKKLLDDAKRRKKIDGNNSAATRVIAKLRLIILWVARSPQRIQA
jgi:hypothetical protein